MQKLLSFEIEENSILLSERRATVHFVPDRVKRIEISDGGKAEAHTKLRQHVRRHKIRDRLRSTAMAARERRWHLPCAHCRRRHEACDGRNHLI